MTVSRAALDLSSYLIDRGPLEEPAPIIWHELFGNNQPVELEIGSGKGLFVINAAASDAGRNFLGVELARKYARLAAERLARRQLPNAKIWRGDARVVMGRLVPEASLRAVHVYFPDPWWKKRHKKRRVFTDDLVAQIERALIPGGELKVASDVEEYFTLIQSLVAANPRFKEVPVAQFAAAEPSPDYLTNFERKYRIEGRTIFRAQYVWH
jgi:tRNA (guanine-N7-)-methyltransferase